MSLQYEITKDKVKSNEQVGVITNYFSSQIIERDFNIIKLNPTDYKILIEKHQLNLIFIDNDIYESDHSWYDIEKLNLQRYLDKKNIKVIIIRNTTKKIFSYFNHYPSWEIDDSQKEHKIEGKIITPTYLNEFMFNPSQIQKTNEVVYLTQTNEYTSKCIDELEGKIRDKTFFFHIDHLARENLKDLVKLIKNSKIIFISYLPKIDRNIISCIECISALYNCVCILDEGYNMFNVFSTQLKNNRLNFQYLKALINSPLLLEKCYVKNSRNAFLRNTLIQKFSLPEVLNENLENIDINISIITSSLRKGKIRKYIQQINSQKYVNLEVILVTHGFTLTEKEKEVYSGLCKFNMIFIEKNRTVSLGNCLNECIDYSKYKYMTKMDDDDFYYPNYLVESWIALKYSQADLVGKGTHFVYLRNNKILMARQMNKQYKYVNQIIGNSIFCETRLLKDYRFSDLSSGEDSDLNRRIRKDKRKIYSLHPYELCVFRSKDKDFHTWNIEEVELMSKSKVISFGNPKDFVMT